MTIFVIISLKLGHSQYKMARFEQVGGMKKGTSTCLKADIDVVVYYEDDEQMLRRKEVRERIMTL